MPSVAEQKKIVADRRGKQYAAKANLTNAIRFRRASKKDVSEARKAAQRAEGTPRHPEKRKDVRRAVQRLLRANRAVDEATDHFRAARARTRRAAKALNVLQQKPSGGGGAVISRSAWGAAGPRGSYASQGPLVGTVLHHTAGPQLPPSASVAQEAAEMRSIQRQHQGQGWTDIGYAFVIFPSGRIYEGRPKQYVGAHTLNNNYGKGGFSIAGNYELVAPTAAAVASAKRVRREIFGAAGKSFWGHRDLGPTACPGRNLYPHTNDGSI